MVPNKIDGWVVGGGGEGECSLDLHPRWREASIFAHIWYPTVEGKTNWKIVA